VRRAGAPGVPLTPARAAPGVAGRSGPTRPAWTRTSRLAAAAALAFAAGTLAGGAAGAGDAERGEAVFRATGGCTCHTDYDEEGDDAPWLAGGRPLSTPFGTYYSTNITPDPGTGIGSFDERDFLLAMQQGLAPDGSHYFPVFPYTSFTRMPDEDLRDLFAYLQTVPPVERETPPPDVPPPFGWRFGNSFWKWLHFEPARFEPDPERSEAWNRGAYLVRGPGHCGECHTPRTLTQGLDDALWLAGSADGPEGELAPNITPDEETGIGGWSAADIDWYLWTGLKPDGDDTQGLMAELIEHGFSHLPQSDRRAIATYLLSLEPIHNEVRIEE